MHKLLLASLVVLLLPFEARAQLAVDKLEIYAAAASTPQTEAFAVTNEGKEVLQVSLSVQDWDRTDNGDNHYYPSGTLPNSCKSSVAAFPLQMLLKPGETQQVRVNLTKSPADRACWAIVFVQTVPAKTKVQGRFITYVLRTGIKVYVHPKVAEADGAIDSMAVAATLKDGRPVATGEKSLLVRFANTGGRHIQTQGKLEIMNAAGNLVKSVNIDEFPTLPGAKRIVRVPVGLLPRGRYTALAILDFRGPDTIAGQYQFQIQ